MDMVMIQKLAPIFFFSSSFSLCCYCFLLTLFLAADPASSSSSGSSTYTPLDNYLIKCGGGQANLTLDNRIWQADTTIANLLSSSSSSSSDSSSSSSSSSSSIEASIVGSPIPLLNTSRIFTRTESYSFPVSSPGPHWLRLYFYSFSYRNFTEAAATFSVVAVSGPSQYTLLHDFNPASSSSSSSAKLIPSPSYLGNYTGFFFKEYTINITSSPFLLTFIPSQGPDAYAFINAIEFISAPPELIPDDPYLLGSSSLSPIGTSSMAIETMYRINVGGPLVSPTNDTSGLYRTWLPNESYLDSSLGVAEINSTLDSIMYTQSGSDELIAPPIVYSTALQIDNQQETASVGFNLSWDLVVQPNFTYVVRFHLCELQYSTGGKRYFNLYLQNQSAYSQLDLGQMYEEYVAIHMDFTVPLAEDSSNLRVQAGPPPNVGSYVFTEAIVNGIEVWKLSNAEGSLDGVSEHLVGASRTNSKTPLAPIVGGAVGGAMAAFALVMAIVCLCCRQRAKVVKQPASTWLPLTLMHEGHSASVASKATVAGSYASSAPSTMAGRVFTFAEILEATRNFDEALVIGVGGFGKVYQAHLDDGTKVAIKRGNPRSEQGIMEFQTEIDMLSKLRHRHLVSLIGYCNENHEMVLVYEFMANGPLRSHLYGTNLPPLSWKQRLEICVGAARGLHYLHTGAMRCIIHRDVKTTNILLDENLVAKVSDFGLSKTGPDLDQSHVSTAVKGSFGYLDPEYFRRQQLTDKSDVYSLGVVLMEVICARPAINPTLPREQVNMAEWAMHWQRKGMLEEVMDPNLAGNICRDSLDIFGKTAEKCLAEDGASRPTMGQVLWSLEYALQLQDRSLLGAMSTTNMDNEEGHTNVVVLPRLDEEEENHRVEDEHEHDDDDDTEDISMSAVFSQMVRPH